MKQILKYIHTTNRCGNKDRVKTLLKHPVTVKAFYKSKNILCAICCKDLYI